MRATRNPSWFNGVRGEEEEWQIDYGADLTRPVESVTWSDATEYCAKMTELERMEGRIAPNAVYRLPTEAEWEYACRARTSTRFSYGDDPDYTNLMNYAWHSDNSEGQTHPVGQKLPNQWGLYDMHGNVWEWCQDWFVNYAGGLLVDPHGPATGSYRVIRGGDCNKWNDSYDWDYPRRCRSAYRVFIFQGPRVHISQGFRVVLAPGQP